jgi:hypothetical protein
VKALRMSEEEYAAARQRIERRTAYVLPKTNKNASPATHKFHVKQCAGYASTHEANRAHELQTLQQSGAIANLREHVPFTLIDTQRNAQGTLRERQCRYIADFVYEAQGRTIVEDCKGYRKGTAYALFAVKRKLMLQRYGIQIHEIAKRNR